MLTLATAAFFGMPITSMLVATLIVFDKLTPAVDTLRAVPRRVNHARFRGSRNNKDRQQSGLALRGRGRGGMEAASAVSYGLTAACLFIVAGIAWLLRIEGA